jgi:thioredoxin 1
MQRRSLVLAALAAPLVLTARGAQAATQVVFEQAAFDAAVKAGKPVLVYISATWCPTCAQQKPILSKLYGDADFKNLMVFNVDFDSRKDVVREMKANMQSTLVVFHDGAEKGRSTGDTDAAGLKALLEKANA